jgi:DNA polymerase III delta prime subunit
MNIMVEDKDAEGGAKQVRYRDKYPCPPFKIVVLDEADSMTQDAQSALRRTMETYSKMTRFCLVCNYVTRIIDPLASRCSKFRFKSLDQGSAVERIDQIARLEGVKLANGVSEELVRVSEGDLRKAITFLQSAARLAAAPVPQTDRKRRVVEEDEMEVDEDGETASPAAISVHTIQEIAGVIPDPTLDQLLDAIFPQGKKIRYEKIAKVVEEMIADGWSAAQTVAQLYDKILYDERVGDLQKMRIAGAFSETDKRLIDGGDEHLAILDLSLRVSGVLCEG